MGGDTLFLSPIPSQRKYFHFHFDRRKEEKK